MGKSDRVWRSDVAKKLMTSTGTSTVEDAIPLLLDAKLSMFGVLKRPVQLEMVASAFGISSRFNYLRMTESARLRPDENNRYVIDINSSHNQARQRFSTAHEIGHKALLDRGIRITKHRGSLSYTFEEREEEEICHVIAATLIGLRPEYIRPHLEKYGFTFKAVEYMSKECNASFEATLRAVLRHCDCAAAGVYCEMHGGLVAGVADKFVVRRAYQSTDFITSIASDLIFSGVTCLREAMRQVRKVIATDEVIAIDNHAHFVHAEAKQMTIYVEDQPKVGVVLLLHQ